MNQTYLPFRPGQNVTITQTDHHEHGGTRNRTAWDFAAPLGTEIVAALGGEVVAIGPAGSWNGGFGEYVVIRNYDGTYDLYAHLLNQSPLKVGDTIDTGTYIGNMGSTGYSTGSHLHWERMTDWFNRKQTGSGLNAYYYAGWTSVDTDFYEFNEDQAYAWQVVTSQNTPQPTTPPGPILDEGDLLWTTGSEYSYWDNAVQSQGGFLGNQGTNGDWEYLGKGDLDGNGSLELLFRHTSNMEVHVWDDGLQSQGRFLGLQSYDWGFEGVLNGRLVWHNQNNLEVSTWDTFDTITGSRLGYQSHDWGEPIVADANGDGVDDLIWHHETALEVSYWDAGNQQAGGRIGLQSSDWKLIAGANLGGGTQDDLIWHNENNNEVSVWFDGVPGYRPDGLDYRLGHVRPWEEVLGVGDTNQDGVDDLVVRVYGNSVYAWLGGYQSQMEFVSQQGSEWSLL